MNRNRRRMEQIGTTDLVRTDLSLFFEHESHELNEYFILHTDLTDHTDLVRSVALTVF